MATYVYAPAGTGANPNSRWDATCGSGSRYCSGSCHGTNAGILPIDILAAASSWIDFWCDPGVLSIRTISQPGNGCGTSPGSPWDDAVLLEMWSGPKVGSNPSGSLLGSVHFAHLATPFIGTLDTGWDANGILRGWSQWAVVPPVGTCSCPTCYTGPHVHMAPVSSYTCHNTSLACSSSPIVKGSTWIYCFS